MGAIWRYKLEQEFILKHKVFEGLCFENEWFSIKDGEIRIEKGYAWDGCTPAYPIIKGDSFPTGLWVGIWDGPLGIDCKPAAWMASLCHDVLCQFREDLLDVSKERSVAIFRELLVLNNAPNWMVKAYPWAVDRFGPQAWRGAFWEALAN